MPGNVLKILVEGQKHQFVTDAQLRKQRIDRAGLYSASPTSVAQAGSLDVIASIRNDQWQRGEPINDLVPSLRAGKSL